MPSKGFLTYLITKLCLVIHISNGVVGESYVHPERNPLPEGKDRITFGHRENEGGT